MDRKRLFKILATLIFIIFVVNFSADKFHWYFSIWYLDMIVHFLSGFWIGLLALYFFAPPTLFFRLILKILLFVFLVGIGWEVFEFITDKVVIHNSFNALDTVSDIFFDLAGGIFAVLYFFKKTMSAKENAV